MLRLKLLALIPICLLGACRAHRYQSLSVSPALIPPPPAPPLDPLIASAIGNYAPIGFPDSVTLPTPVLGGSGQKRPCCTFNLSTRPAPPSPPRSAYFLSAPKAQAEIVKLFAGSANGGGSTQLKALFETIYNSDEKATVSTNKARIESTFTHLLDAMHDWDRLHYVAVFLLLRDPEARFVDTNQFESILRDIEVGTLNQTVTANAKLGGKKTNYGAATVAGAASSLPVQELSPELSLSYVDALQRKLKEQLNYRSASIEADGRLFRLVQRASAENVIPSMTRQVLSLDFLEKINLAQLKIGYENKSLKSLAVEALTQPHFCGVTAKKNDFNFTYEIKATPVMLSTVRVIGNDKGARTLGLDDDDRITYDVHLDVKPDVVMTTVRIRQYTIRLRRKGSQTWQFLNIRRNPGDPLATAVFGSDLDASWFATFLKELIPSATPEQRKSGQIFSGISGLNQDYLAIGLAAQDGSPSLDDIDPATIEPITENLGPDSRVIARLRRLLRFHEPLLASFAPIEARIGMFMRQRTGFLYTSEPDSAR